MKEESKKKKILRISGLIGLFLLVFGLSYALFTVTLNGTKKVKIKTGKLELQLLDSNNNPIYITDQNNTTSYEINLDNQVPVSDEEGLESTAFEFKLKNTGNIKASYTIYLDDVALESGEERIDDQYIRYSLTKNGSEDNPQALSTRELDKGVIDADNTTNAYTLKIWIAEDATNEAMDKVFNATLRVEGSQYVEPESPYGTKIAERQLSETITATYYQPEDTGYNNTNKVKRMSNIEKIDNEETYEGGTLVISGTGVLSDRTWDIHLFLAGFESINDVETDDGDPNFVWDDEHGDYAYIYKPTTVIIEEGITRIGEYCFFNLISIKTITLPSTVKSIGLRAFDDQVYDDSIGITHITLPEGLEELEYNALKGLLLRNITIPSTVTSIYNGGFHDMPLLEEIKILSENVNFHPTSDQYGPNISVPIYCKTQACYDNLQSQQPINNTSGNATVILDPTKFE